jgi:hypothetical protein
VNELLPRLQVATAPQPRPSAGRRRARPRALLTVSETRQRERDQTLTHSQISTRQSGSDRVATHPDTTAQQAVHNREIADESVRSAAARRRSQSIRLADKLAVTGFDVVGLRNAGRPPGASRLRPLLKAAPGVDPDSRSPEGAQTAAESNVPQRHVRRAVSSVLGPCRSAVLRGSRVAPIPAVDPRAERGRESSLRRESIGRAGTRGSRSSGHSFRDDAHGADGCQVRSPAPAGQRLLSKSRDLRDRPAASRRSSSEHRKRGLQRPSWTLLSAQLVR